MTFVRNLRPVLLFYPELVLPDVSFPPNWWFRGFLFGLSESFKNCAFNGSSRFYFFSLTFGDKFFDDIVAPYPILLKFLVTVSFDLTSFFPELFVGLIGITL